MFKIHNRSDVQVIPIARHAYRAMRWYIIVCNVMILAIKALGIYSNSRFPDDLLHATSKNCRLKCVLQHNVLFLSCI